MFGAVCVTVAVILIVVVWIRRQPWRSWRHLKVISRE
jgi:hypothetical protein